ncbi:MAG: hypothetical protein ACRD0D_05200 [Acidimicrobiales bacterium]
MAGSILESVTADPGAAGAGARAPQLALRRFRRHPGGMIGLVLTALFAGVGLLSDRLAPGDPFAYAGTPLAPPVRRPPLRHRQPRA